MLITTSHLIGCGLKSQDGSLGSVADLYFDDFNWTVRYLVANTGGWLTGRQVLLSPESLCEPEPSGKSLKVCLTRDQIQNSPPLDADKPVNRQQEEALRRYYDWTPYWGTPVADPLRPDVYSPEQAAVVAMARRKAAPPEQEKGDPHLRSVEDVVGYAVEVKDGELGRIHDFIVDTGVWSLRYAVINTAPWLPGRKVLLGAEWILSVDWDRQTARVELTRDQVRNSPVYEPAKPIDRQLEEKIKAHYGSPANFA
ncbi:MAG: PRC-barrel domain containing protein [Elusimicrobia bacterium]|nr:PRC-barrel domain containing protein [Elusimicrobiota bacterium]